MSSHRWRNSCLVLGAICLVLLWRSCHAAPELPSPGGTPTELALLADRAERMPPCRAETTEVTAAEPAHADDGLHLYGVTVPSWVTWLAPHPGEDLRAYRDRMLPFARAAIAPQRARVARSRDEFAALAKLDTQQRALLDDAAHEAATAIQDRVMNAALGGDFAPETFKPMAGVNIARDLLDIVDRGNHRFLDSLHDDQRAQLAQHPFDFADYLVFSTPWEDALKLLD